MCRAAATEKQRVAAGGCEAVTYDPTNVAPGKIDSRASQPVRGPDSGGLGGGGFR